MPGLEYRCTSCDRVLPGESFAPSRTPPTNQTVRCRECCARIHREWRESRPSVEIPARRCESCNEWFVPKRQKSRACSVRCRDAARTRRTNGSTWLVRLPNTPEMIDHAYLSTCRYGRGETSRQIAARLGISHASVQHGFQRLGIPAEYAPQCQYCGEHFPSTNLRAVYCSERCGARARLVRKYGIEPREYHDRLVAQGGVCAICGGGPVEGDRVQVLVVDHDHDTGGVRGLLCGPCNTGLGHFRDRTDLLMRAVQYLT